VPVLNPPLLNFTTQEHEYASVRYPDGEPDQRIGHAVSPVQLLRINGFIAVHPSYDARTTGARSRSSASADSSGERAALEGLAVQLDRLKGEVGAAGGDVQLSGNVSAALCCAHQSLKALDVPGIAFHRNGIYWGVSGNLSH
jgi:hypothetical protein